MGWVSMDRSIPEPVATEFAAPVNTQSHVTTSQEPSRAIAPIMHDHLELARPPFHARRSWTVKIHSGAVAMPAALPHACFQHRRFEPYDAKLAEPAHAGN